MPGSHELREFNLVLSRRSDPVNGFELSVSDAVISFEFAPPTSGPRPVACNVARSAGWVVTASVEVLGLTPQAIAMSPASRAGLSPA